MSSTSDYSTLLIAIPCFNEEKTISTLISDIYKLKLPGLKFDILVVDDGSSDNTRQLAASHGTFVISHPFNKGVGSAFQTAVQYAVIHKYDFMINIDADSQFNPFDIPFLLEPLLSLEADMVTCSRFFDSRLTPTMPKTKLYGNYLMSILISILLAQRFYDVSCGFRAYSRETLLNLNLQASFTYTQETFLDLSFKGLRIVEVPLPVKYFNDRKSRVAHDLCRYTYSTLKIIFRAYRDYYPLKFFALIAITLLLPSFALGSLFVYNYITYGRFTGSLYAGLTSAFLFLLSLICILFGLLADMLDRIRLNQERVLYYIRRST